jgi:hypothetical protein
MPTNDTPVTDAELDAYYGVTLCQTAIELGEDEVTEDLELFTEFLSEYVTDEREPCRYFGPISTKALFTQILLNRNANTEQLAAAAREIRSRYIECYSEVRDRAAMRAMEP